MSGSHQELKSGRHGRAPSLRPQLQAKLRAACRSRGSLQAGLQHGQCQQQVLSSQYCPELGLPLGLGKGTPFGSSKMRQFGTKENTRCSGFYVQHRPKIRMPTGVVDQASWKQVVVANHLWSTDESDSEAEKT